MIKAKDRKWNSATTLYIAQRLEQISSGKRIRVLDMGCGEGIVINHLLDGGYDIYGYDFPHRLGDFDQHIKITEGERHILFENSLFDVVHANQVFEHVKFLDRMFDV